MRQQRPRMSINVLLIVQALFALMLPHFACADPNERAENHIHSSFLSYRTTGSTRVFDNAFLDRVFGKQREAEREKNNSRPVAKPNAPLADTPVTREDPLIDPNRSFLSGIERNTPAKRAAALRLAEKGRQLLLRNDSQRAITHLERALGLYSIPYIHFYLARAHYESGNVQRSLDFLDVAESWLAQQPSWIGEIADLKRKASAHQSAQAGGNRRSVEVASRINW